MTKWLRIIAIALVPALWTACDDDLTEAREEEEQQEQEVNNVAFLRLVIGSTTIVVNRTGVVIGPEVIVGPPGAVITAFPLDANSQPVTLSTTDFRLDVTPDASAHIAFTRTGAFSGNFTRNAPGAATITVGLFHVPRNHYDFGPHTVQVTVQ